MKRFFLLWLLLLVVALVVTIPLNVFVIRNVDLRFEPLLTSVIAPALQAILLLKFFPSLSDPRSASPWSALRSPFMARLASILLGAVALMAVLMFARLLSVQVIDRLRGLLALSAGMGFLLAWRRGIGGTPVATVLFILLGALSGRFVQLADHVFPSQPQAFRWLVFFSVAGLLILLAVLRAVEGLRHSSAEAAALLEWSLAPATVASLIVAGNIFFRPYVTSGWSLLANVLALSTMAMAQLAAIVASRTPGREPLMGERSSAAR